MQSHIRPMNEFTDIVKAHSRNIISEKGMIIKLQILFEELLATQDYIIKEQERKCTLCTRRE